MQSSGTSGERADLTEYLNLIAIEEGKNGGFHQSANRCATFKAAFVIDSVKSFLSFIAQWRAGRGLLPEHAAGQQIGRVDGHQVVRRDFRAARGPHDAVGVAQTSAIQRVANRAGVREVRQQLARGDVAFQRLALACRALRTFIVKKGRTFLPQRAIA